MKYLFSLMLVLCCPYLAISTTLTKTLMIDPAGHAKQPGRQLYQSYERAETFKCAETLKLELEKRSSNIRCVLSRAPGDEIVPLQNASFANRLGIDFFVQLLFYKETAEKPKVHIYYLAFDPIIDAARHTPKPFACLAVTQAHFANIATSINCAQKCKDGLSSREYQKLFDCTSIYGLPIKPLVGITAPAIAIEIGLKSDGQWSLFVEPLAIILEDILK